MRKKLVLLFLVLMAAMLNAQKQKGFSLMGVYQPISGASSTKSYIKNGFENGFGLAFGVGYSVVNHDKKIHPGVNYSVNYRFFLLDAKDSPSKFKISGIDAPIEFEFGSKAFGLQAGISMFVPSKYEGDIYNADSLQAEPFHFDNSTNGNMTPWLILNAHAGVHIHIYNKDVSRITLFSNIGSGFTRLNNPFAKKPAYKGPLPNYIEAGLKITIYPK